MGNLPALLGQAILDAAASRNRVVFEGATPSKVVVVTKISDDAELWRPAGLFRGVIAPVDKWRTGDVTSAIDDISLKKSHVGRRPIFCQWCMTTIIETS
jgi:hypothetical protein